MEERPLSRHHGKCNYHSCGNPLLGPDYYGLDRAEIGRGRANPPYLGG